MPLSRIDGDLYVTGTLTAASMNVPAGSVSDADVEAQANVAASKLEHMHTVNLAVFDHATDVTTRRMGIWSAENPGTIDRFEVWVSVAAGAATTVTVDLLKNGTTVLTSAVSIDNTLTAYTSLAATISSANFTDGDKFEISATLSGTNEPKGLNCRLVARERGY